MTPVQFGCSARPLFGMVHPAQPPARGRGVVLCNPMGQEAIRAHRAYRQLALALARARFDVMRFDYSCTGDSAGEAEAGTVERWVEDIGVAMEELRDTAGLGRLSLVGLRLGGTLALLAARDRGGVESVVMWDPVVSGAAYVRELRETHREYLERELGGVIRGVPAQDEALGFPLMVGLERGLCAIDLRGAPGGGAREAPGRVVLITSRPADVGLVRHLQALGGAVAQREVASGAWNSDEAMNAAAVPHEILRVIVESV